MKNNKVMILEITGEPIASGGQEMFIINVLRHIDMTSFQIDLLTPYYCDNERYRKVVEDRGGRVVCFNLPFHPGSFRWNVLNPMCGFIRNNHYDIVHIHSGSITVLAFASLAARMNGIRKIVVHSHSTGVGRSLKYRLLKVLSYPFLKYIPSDYCACSVAAGEWKFPKSVVKNKLRVINNGIDLNLFSPQPDIRKSMREKLGFDEHALVIGNVGRFFPEKNHPFIVKVFTCLKKKVSNSKLLLVGDGELMEQFKRQVADMELAMDVVFTGRVSNVQDYVQAMDVFVFPSFYEGLGLVGVEAQGVGIPVIASTNVPPEMKLTEDVTYLGLDSVNDWVEKIIEVFAHPRQDNVSLIREQGYDINQTAEELRKIYISE